MKLWSVRSSSKDFPKDSKGQWSILNLLINSPISAIGLKQQFVNIRSTKYGRMSLEGGRTNPRNLSDRSQPDNSGNKNLPKTQMPWILPLDVPVPGLPWPKKNRLPSKKRGIALTVKSKGTLGVIAHWMQEGWKPNLEKLLKRLIKPNSLSRGSQQMNLLTSYEEWTKGRRTRWSKKFSWRRILPKLDPNSLGKSHPYAQM